jgi:hypothetical protein
VCTCLVAENLDMHVLNREGLRTHVDLHHLHMHLRGL